MMDSNIQMGGAAMNEIIKRILDHLSTLTAPELEKVLDYVRMLERMRAFR